MSRAMSPRRNPKSTRSSAPYRRMSVNNHMVGEQPRMVFLHYYGSGPALTLAQGFRAAVDELGKHGKTMTMS